MASRRRCCSPYDPGCGEEMVKPALVVLTLVIVTLLLVACGIFSASPFPANLPFVAAFINLEDSLDSFLDGRRITEVDYLFHTIRDDSDTDSGRDVLFLILRLKDTGDNKLLVLNANLELIEELDNRAVGNLVLFNSNSALTPSGSEFVVGLEVFDGDSLEHMGHLEYDFAVPELPDPGAVGFADNTLANRNYWTFIAPGGVHTVSYLDNAWAGGTVNDSNAVIDPRQAIKLTCDGQSEEVVIHFINSNDTELVRYPFLGFADLDIAGTLPYPYTSTFNTPGGMITFGGEDDPRNSHYTRDGIIIANEDGSMNRYDFSGRKEDEWDLDSGSAYITSFDIDGAFYYYFNFNERRLYKAHTWWD